MTEPSDDAPVLPEPSLPPATPPTPDASLAPTLPPAVAPTPTRSEEELFDAKAMVAATTAHVANPAYGGLPEATEESLEAQRKLRAQARRKRTRNRYIAWAVVAVFIGGIGAAGWFAYQAWQDDQDQLEADREAAQADDSAGAAPGALTPLGDQQAVIEALEDINSSDAQLSGGGLRDIVDEAQDVVDDMNTEAGAGDVTTPAPPTFTLTLDDVYPAGAMVAATPIDAVDGYQRYLVNVAEWQDADPVGYVTWLQTVQAEPQAAPGSPSLGVFPSIRPGQAGIAIQRDGDQLVGAVIVGVDPEVRLVLG